MQNWLLRFVHVVPSGPLKAPPAPPEAPLLTGPAEAAMPPVPVYVRVFAVVTPSSNLASVVGAPPAPPPSTIRLSASNAEDDSCVVELKYGIPPEVTVPETVKGKIDEAVAVCG